MATEQDMQEASSMGWVPQDAFKGDPAKWVDADVFVSKGRTMLPLVNKAKKELEEKLHARDVEVARLSKLVEASQESIQALEEFHTSETKRQVENAKKKIIKELAKANTDGDAALAAELTSELVDLNTAIQKSEKAPVNKPTASQKQEEQLDPAFLAFASENPWFGSDIRKTNRAMGIAQILRADPENDNLTGKAFFAKVLSTMEGQDRRPPPAKVSGGSPTGNSGGGSSGKSFADLPPEAKEACAKQAARLVGEGRRHKTLESWQNAYAEIYFREY